MAKIKKVLLATAIAAVLFASIALPALADKGGCPNEKAGCWAAAVVVSAHSGNRGKVVSAFIAGLPEGANWGQHIKAFKAGGCQ